MIKVEALFAFPEDRELFLSQVKEKILHWLYQMPYIEKIEITPYYDTPLEVQTRYLDQPVYYQIGVYYKTKEEIEASFRTEQGIELAQFLRSNFGDTIIGCVGEADIFYKSDLEQIQRTHIFSDQN